MLRDQILQKKLQDLRAMYQSPIDQRAITQMENELRRRIAETKLAEIEPMPMIINDAYMQVRQINFLLAFDENMTTEFRAALIKERAAHQFWLERLGAWNAERIIEDIDRFASERLKSDDVKK